LILQCGLKTPECENHYHQAMSEKTIILGGGCFWCTEAVYVRMKGITDVESGYANGHIDRPSYEQVCSGETGHAEVVRLRYDSRQIGLADILEVFFAVHDPTTLNRQGNDVGTQYRSAIYSEDPADLELARAYIAQLESQRVFGAPIVTEVQALQCYFPAEAYHQDYFEQHPNQGYCAFVVRPKVAKFEKNFARHLNG
jgi:peptide-methionine (S)-S-oxide reductase